MGIVRDLPKRIYTVEARAQLEGLLIEDEKRIESLSSSEYFSSLLAGSVEYARQLEGWAPKNVPLSEEAMTIIDDIGDVISIVDENERDGVFSSAVAGSLRLYLENLQEYGIPMIDAACQLIEGGHYTLGAKELFSAHDVYETLCRPPSELGGAPASKQLAHYLEEMLYYRPFSGGMTILGRYCDRVLHGQRLLLNIAYRAEHAEQAQS